MKGIRRAGACPARAVAYAGKRGVFLFIAFWLILLSVDPPHATPLNTSSTSGETSDTKDEKGEKDQPSLEPSMAAITRAFRTETPDPLKSILPKDGKVFVSLRTIGSEAGYFGRDQVHFIFARIFRNLGYIRFHLAEQDVRTSNLKKSTAHCVGFWTYKNKEGKEVGCQLFFVLTLRDGVWSLVQIREAL